MLKVMTTGLAAAALLASAPTTALAAPSAQTTNIARTTVSTAAKQAPTISWTTITRGYLKGVSAVRGAESIAVPYLNGASAKARKSFDAAVSKKYAEIRKSLVSSHLSKHCAGPVYLGGRKLQSAVVSGRYASAAFSLGGASGCGAAHSLATSASVTIDLRTGKPVRLSSFLTNHGTAPVKAAQTQLKAKHATLGSPKNYRQLVGQASSWSVSAKGVTLNYDPYVYGSYAQGVLSVTIPWKIAH